MRYVYPAILFPEEGQVGVKVPDLPGCFTFGKDKAEALIMAKDAIEIWLWDAVCGLLNNNFAEQYRQIFLRGENNFAKRYI